MGTYYATTPIYYVNDRPHIGHCYTTLLVDVAARYQRLIRGEPDPSFNPDHPTNSAAADVFFLTGTDEHADKVSSAATERGLSPLAWADQNAAEFRSAFAFMNFAPDDFIRTTEPRHADKVPEFLRELIKTGDVYLGDYVGWYDLGQEEYVPENDARERDYKSAISGKPLEKRTEKNYFFKLSKHADWLREKIEANDGFIRPTARKNEVLGRIKQGLLDVPISRSIGDTPADEVWGVLMPDDPGHRVYVWIDALFNYLTTVDTDDRRRYWPADVHVIGKDILWFHAVIWPCMLKALEDGGALKDRYPNGLVPKCIYAHGWWISEGKKMSKSMGNFIDLELLKAYADRYSLDALRWYMITQGPLGANDADFAHAKFIEVYNADLANGIGNSASRVGNMIAKYFDGKVPESDRRDHFFTGDARTPLDIALEARSAAGKPVESSVAIKGFEFQLAISEALRKTDVSLDSLDLEPACRQGMVIVDLVDEFISHTAPFTLAKKLDEIDGGADALASILYACAEALRIASILLSPAMPEKMAELWRNWNCAPASGVPLAELCAFGGEHSLKPGQSIAKGEALFMRADADEPKPGDS